MDKIKRFVNDYRYQIFLITEIALLLLGAYIAYLTVYRFEVFVRAVLGLTILYLIHLEYAVFKRLKNESFGVKFELPKDLRYFIMDFFVIIIFVWAGVQVLDLIRYLIRLFTN